MPLPVPELGQPRAVHGVKLYGVDLSSANPSGGPGHAMQMRTIRSASSNGFSSKLKLARTKRFTALLGDQGEPVLKLGQQLGS